MYRVHHTEELKSERNSYLWSPPPPLLMIWKTGRSSLVAISIGLRSYQLVGVISSDVFLTYLICSCVHENVFCSYVHTCVYTMHPHLEMANNDVGTVHTWVYTYFWNMHILVLSITPLGVLWYACLQHSCLFPILPTRHPYSVTDLYNVLELQRGMNHVILFQLPSPTTAIDGCFLSIIVYRLFVCLL